ncbi:MAG TPA: hypothetical protein ENK16_04720 [Chromatiales bacterium]|nr:hypothetical protein [Chromatiales bacterium]
MLSERIDTVQLRELAAQGSTERMRFGIDSFPRLRASGVSGDSGTVDLSVGFWTDREQRPCIDLKIAGQFDLTCQRCLEPVSVPVSVDASLTVVDKEADAELLEDPFDSVVLVDGCLQLLATVEDELLSMVPLAPRHGDQEDCTAGALNEKLPGNRPFENLDDLLGAGRSE